MNFQFILADYIEQNLSVSFWLKKFTTKLFDEEEKEWLIFQLFALKESQKTVGELFDGIFLQEKKNYFYIKVFQESKKFPERTQQIIYKNQEERNLRGCFLRLQNQNSYQDFFKRGLQSFKEGWRLFIFARKCCSWTP